MKIKSFKKEKNNKYKIIFESGEDIVLYDDVIVKYNLLVNKTFDTNKLTEIIKYNSNLDAYYLSLKYISKKMRTKLEIRKYLEKKDIDSKTIDETINKLVNNKAINEDLYIQAFCNDQINFSNIGPNKIVSKLKDLGSKSVLLITKHLGFLIELKVLITSLLMLNRSTKKNTKYFLSLTFFNIVF